MSDDAGAFSSVTLSLTARPGIAIRLLDGALQEVAQGTASLEAVVRPGLYMVEWSSAGRQSQTMVRLDGKQPRFEVKFDPSAIEGPGVLDPSAADRLSLIDAVNGSIRPSERAYASSIVLVVSSDASASEHVPNLELRLYDREDVAMRANRDDTPNLALGPGERAHCYRVRPGRYHIGFKAITGEQLCQSVPALAGRQTLVFLTLSRTNLVFADGDEFHTEEGVGIDPSRTAMVTVRGDEKDYRVRERLRLASLMSFDLANGTNSLSGDVVEVLDDPKTDPLLRLYGALVAVSAFDRAGTMRSIENNGAWSFPPYPDQTWIARLKNWVSDPGQAGLPTDALAASWRLEHISPQSFGSDEWSKLPSRIEAPPMMDCSWRWAIEESIARPDAVRGTSVMAATSRSAGGSLPWLCWELSAAKAKFVPAKVTAEDLPALVAQVAEKVAAFVEPDTLSRTFSKGLEALSPDLKATALRAMQLVVPDAKSVTTETIADLAVALGLPSRLLQKRLVRTSEALDQAAPALIDQASALSQENSLNDDAPALFRRIKYKNDLQKGRFGGKATRRGFTVSATFDDTSSKNWVKVAFVVDGPAKDGEEVQFHRHDSFKPQMLKKRFKGGRAKMSVTVWGGFTLGVWIPAYDIELELDLAELKDAPRIVRER